jgi:hypothetical protein
MTAVLRAERVSTTLMRNTALDNVGVAIGSG